MSNRRFITTFIICAILTIGTFSTANATITAASSTAPNLVSNPSVEDSTSPASIPLRWAKGGYGSNTRIFTYPVTGFNSAKAVKVEITNYTRGDAKWFFDDVPVIPGKTYVFSDLYTSDISSIIDVRYKMLDGTYTYRDIAFPGATNSSSSPQSLSVEIVVPDQAVSLTVFHLINMKGYLITDEFSLTEISTNSPTPDPTNLVTNPGFQLSSASGMPSGWKKGGWGTLSSEFTYPVANEDGSRAVRVDITSYTFGDAKWYFRPISSLAMGIYTYSDTFKSNIESTLTVQLEDASGAYSYKDIAVLPASDTYQNVSADFVIPNGMRSVTVFHLIEGVGFLILENVAVRFKSAPKGVFTTGAVTFRFDDGWLSQYDNALPRLNALGFKGTFYIVSQQIGDNGYSQFVTKNQISEIYSEGHEIGAHTRTHPRLSSLSADQQTMEVNGSRQDLLNMNVGPVSTFAYPYGDYNPTTISIVKDSEFIGAVSTISGFVNPLSDPYQLEGKSIQVDTSADQIKSWIDDAVQNKKWLVLTFHEVNTLGNFYSITPDNFDQVANYVASKKIPVVTILEGVQSVK